MYTRDKYIVIIANNDDVCHRSLILYIAEKLLCITSRIRCAGDLCVNTLSSFLVHKTKHTRARARARAHTQTRN